MGKSLREVGRERLREVRRELERKLQKELERELKREVGRERRGWAKDVGMPTDVPKRIQPV